MVKKICLDSQVLIWGIKKESTPKRRDMIDKANSLLNYLAKPDSNLIIIVPSVVIMELLMPCFLLDHTEVIRQINTRLNPVPFDIAAARAAAQVWQSKQSDSTINELKTNDDAKPRIKVYCQIIGTAISNKVDCICSEDGALKKLAADFIDVKTIDELLAVLNPLPLIDEININEAKNLT